MVYHTRGDGMERAAVPHTATSPQPCILHKRREPAIQLCPPCCWKAAMGKPISLLLLLPACLSILLNEAVSGLHVTPPVHCDSARCTLSVYQGTWNDRTPCRAAMALYPTSEEELIQAVARASKANTKIKVVSKYSHSLPKLVCPGGDDGIILSTRDYDTQIVVDTTKQIVTADAGVLLRDLVDKVAEYGLALPHSPYWDGVSVAGMISTGAHGSGWWGKGSCPHDHVVKLRLVVPASAEEGYAKVVELTSEDQDLDAARLSLGVLGAISKVTLQLEPLFKRSVTLQVRDDKGLEDDMLELAKEHEFGCIHWYPSSGKALFKIDDRVSLKAEGDGTYHQLIMQKTDIAKVDALTAAFEDAQRSQDTQQLCTLADMEVNVRYSQGDGLLNNRTTFTGYPVVGLNHKMQTSGNCCDREDDIDVHHSGRSYIWGTGFLFHDISIIIPADRVKEAIADIKKLRDVGPHRMCGLGLLVGVFMRFVKGSTAYLAQKQDAVAIEIDYYRPREDRSPTSNEDIVEEIEQMLLYKYGGRPHWGKNRELAFQGMRERTASMDKFLETRSRLDPRGLFSSDWSDAVLGISTTVTPSSKRSVVQLFGEHCALEGLCVCEEDSHCHPDKGYFCRPGIVYKEARVCRFEAPIKHIEL